MRGPQALVNGHRLGVRYIVVRLFVPHCTNNDSATFSVALEPYRWREIQRAICGTDCAFDVPWPFVPHFPTERQRSAAALQVNW